MRRPCRGARLIAISASLLAAELLDGALLSTPAEGAPYVDTRHRFSLVLPKDWRPTPAFGDTKGMVFRRDLARRRKAFVLLMVRVDPKDDPRRTATEYMEAIEAGLRSERGFERLEEGDREIAGHRALYRRYRARIDPSDSVTKVMLVYIFEADDTFYLLHFESRSRDFSATEDDRRSILESFLPAALASGPSTPSDNARPSPAQPDLSEPDLAPSVPATTGLTPRDLVGEWRSSVGTVLELGRDGRFRLATATGSYRVQGQRMFLETSRGRVQVFVFDLDGDTLTLRSDALPGPSTYRRVPVRDASSDSGSVDGAEVVDSRSDEGARATMTAGLVGRWTTPTPGGPVDLELRSDHTFSLGEVSGTWRESLGSIRFAQSPSESILYQYELRGRELVLSGGDLDEPTTFRRTQ